MVNNRTSFPFIAFLAASTLFITTISGCEGKESCQPRCIDDWCGNDGCGGTCQCLGNLTCNQTTFQCQACQPNCPTNTCGEDGCGGTCSCISGYTCDASSQQCFCQPNCINNIGQTKQCGNNGCGGSCGTCSQDLTCNETTGMCVEKCVPQCEEKQCGDDLCGGSCGDCQESFACENGVCVVGATCSDNLKNGDETDVDCGGSCETACKVGQGCNGSTDCTSEICQDNRCQAPDTCFNSTKDRGETDVDCGGDDCTQCPVGKYCIENDDCLSLACMYGVCVAPSCDDQLKNQNETSVDCGGVCDGCEDGQACLVPDDCTSGRCEDLVCNSCYDNKKNGDESDVDCGGDSCERCPDGRACNGTEDCANDGCEYHVCCTLNQCGFCGELAAEVCDGKDNDCNGQTDDGLTGPLCEKQLGVCEGARAQCHGADGFVCDFDAYHYNSWAYALTEEDDCNDGGDNDCDGLTDEEDVNDCCEPDCWQKECGDDGCGGSCGTCNEGFECDEYFECEEIVADPCYGVTEFGCCEDSLLYYCLQGVLYMENCADSGCGWHSYKGTYNCGSNGQDPSGQIPIECWE